MRGADAAKLDIRALGIAFAIIPGTLMLVTSASFLLGSPIAWWMAPAAAIAGAVYLNLRGLRLQETAIYVVYLAVAMALSAMLYDTSWDGLTYHQEIITWLLNGVNPFNLSHGPSDMSLWALHYCKLTEICQSCIVKTCGLMETGKAYNYILVAAMSCIAWGTLRRRLSRKRTAAVMVTLLCNPVLVSQFFSFYIDFTLYCYLAISICCMIEPGGKPRLSDWALLMLMLAMSAGTKFNIFFDECVAIAAWVAWLLWHLHRRMGAVAGGLSVAVAAVSVTLLFWHPYMTNLINWGNPLYPLIGSDLDIMSGNTADIYLTVDNRFANFFINLVGGPFCNADRGYIIVSNDTRVGGYGVFILPMVLIAAWSLWKGRREYPAALYIAVVSLLSCFIFKESWWARYNPQLWLVAVAAVAVADRGIVVKALVAMSMLTMLCSLGRLALNIEYTLEMHRLRRDLQGVPLKIDTDYPQYMRKLDEWGLQYERVESLDSARCVLLPINFYIELPPGVEAKVSRMVK